MTRVSDQAKRCETAGSIPVQTFSAICPVSHFFLLEIDKAVIGAESVGDLKEKTWDMRDTRHQTMPRNN